LINVAIRVNLLLIWYRNTDEALLQYSQISTLPEADSYNVKSLQVWLNCVGNFPVTGAGALSWGKRMPSKTQESLRWQFLLLLRSIFCKPKPKKDNLHLIVPRPESKVDGLTLWIANEFVPFYQSLRDKFRNRNGDTESKAETGSDTNEHMDSNSAGCLPLWKSSCQRKQKAKPTGSDSVSQALQGSPSEECITLNSYSEDRMLRFTSSITTLIACLLPTIAIIVLANLHSTVHLLGAIAGFTAIFAIGLMCLTDSRTSRIEIFTATAAYV